MPQKNQKMMIRAFADVLKIHSDYELVIYGDGPSEMDLKSLIAELGISANVSLPGNVKNLHNSIKSAEIFVLSSEYEGMPNALIEAMCLGLPAISTKVSGATDLIRHGQNGILVELDDQAGFTHAMLDLIENQELSAEISKNAVKLNEDLELSKIMNEWILFISKVLS